MRNKGHSIINPAERRGLACPFAPAVLAKARELTQQYRLVIQREPELGYMGCTVEMPLVMSDGRSVPSCARSVLEATAAAIAALLEGGESPPFPARDFKRDQQVNVRFSADEKFCLEVRSRSAGFRSISDGS